MSGSSAKSAEKKPQKRAQGSTHIDGDYSAGDPPLAGRIPAECAGVRADQALARMFPQFSRNRLSAWLRSERIRIDGRSFEPDQKVWGGENVVLHPEPDPSNAPQAQAIEFPVVHEDEDLLVVDKPAGMVVHPGSGNWSGTLLNALLHHCPALASIPRAGIVHRLDKDTSGLLVVAKTLEAHTALVRQMQARTVERIYLAVAQGAVSKDGSVDAPIGRDPRHRTRMAVVGGGRSALTRFKVLERYANATLLECRLATGRTHQIRVHLHSIGHPLLGDPVYRSGPARGTFSRQALHATRLAFVHPRTQEGSSFSSELPDDMQALIAELRAELRTELRAGAPAKAHD